MVSNDSAFLFYATTSPIWRNNGYYHISFHQLASNVLPTCRAPPSSSGSESARNHSVLALMSMLDGLVTAGHDSNWKNWQSTPGVSHGWAVLEDYWIGGIHDALSPDLFTSSLPMFHGLPIGQVGFPLDRYTLGQTEGVKIGCQNRDRLGFALVLGYPDLRRFAQVYLPRLTIGGDDESYCGDSGRNLSTREEHCAYDRISAYTSPVSLCYPYRRIPWMVG